MRSPFKFLDYYEKGDQQSFFGREQETERLYQLVKQNRLSLVYGPSGTGKTSLVRCGLANRFGVTEWLPLFIKREENLPAALLRQLKALLPETDTDNVPELIKAVYEEYLRPVYLIFDQLEELFIDGSPTEQAAFTEQIADIMAGGLPCRLLLIIREDYVGQLYHFERRIPIYYERRLRVEPLSAPVLREEVLQKSFALFQMELDNPTENLDQILENLTEKRRIVPLPWLQVYLDQLWQQCFATAYPRGWSKEGHPPLSIGDADIAHLGKIENVLETYLQSSKAEVQKLLPPDTPPDLVNQVLDSLVTDDGTKRNLRYAATEGHWTWLPPSPAILQQLPPAQLQQAVVLLAKSRLLRIENQNIELAHDSLAAIIDRQRSAEQRQRNEYRRQIQSHYGLHQQTGEYLTNKQLALYEDMLPGLGLPPEHNSFVAQSRTFRAEEAKAYIKAERRKANRTRLVAAVFGLLALFAVFQMCESKQQTKEAEDAKERAEASEKIAADETQRAEKFLQVALDSAEVARAERAKALAQADTARIERERALVLQDSAVLLQALAEAEAARGRHLDRTLTLNQQNLLTYLQEQGKTAFAVGDYREALVYLANARFFMDTTQLQQLQWMEQKVTMAQQAVEAERLFREGYLEEADTLFADLILTAEEFSTTHAVKRREQVETSLRVWEISVAGKRLDTIRRLTISGDLTSLPIAAQKLQQLTDVAFVGSNSLDFYINALPPVDNLTLMGLNIDQLPEKLTSLALRKLQIFGLNRMVEAPLAMINPDQLQYLEIYSNDALTSISGWEQWPQLQELIITSNDALTSINGWERWPQLQKLKIINNDALTSISDWERWPQLKELVINNNDALTSISGWEQWPQLQKLVIMNNVSLSSISGWEQWPQLKELEINNNSALTSISDWERWPQLQKLEISTNVSLSSISGWEQWPQLQKLEINNNYALSSISGWEQWPQLKELEINNNDALTSISDWERWPQLQKLEINDNGALTSISGWEQWPQLKELVINNNDALTSISDWERWPQLQKLEINDNGALTSISGWEQWPQLKELVINNNDELTSISDWEQWPQLQKLEINSNDALTSISDWEQWPQLKELEIINNDALTSISDWEQWPQLQKLEINSNDALTSISDWEQWPQLKELEIINNGALSSISGWEQWPQLQKLEIIYNDALTSIRGWELWPQLESLVIRSNDALTSLSGWDKWPQLQKLEINENGALTSIRGWERWPQLQKLEISTNDALTSIRGWEQWPQLQELIISSNDALSSINGWEQWPQLQKLEINSNRALTSISGWEQWSQLKHLEINSNDALTSISGWEQWPQFQKLIIYNNYTLTSISGWKQWPLLKGMMLGGSETSLITQNGARLARAHKIALVANGSLRQLSPSLVELASLDSLYLYKLPVLTDLPDTLLSGPLRYLHLYKTGIDASTIDRWRERFPELEIRTGEPDFSNF